MTTLGTVMLWLWLAFWAYWIMSAFSAKKNSRSRLGGFVRLRLGILVVVLILVHLRAKQAYTFNDPAAGSNKAVLAIGFIIFVLGLLLAIWARLHLGKNWGMPMTEKQDPELVTTGPYRFIRHPIYTGLLLAMLGAVFVISLYFLAIMAISGTYFIYSATVEEKTMMRQFPKVYPGYKNKTKMLVPFIF